MKKNSKIFDASTPNRTERPNADSHVSTFRTSPGMMQTGSPGPLSTEFFNADGTLRAEMPTQTAEMLLLFKSLIRAVNPEYLFEYEANDFMDLKANRMTRDTAGVHLPEIERSAIVRLVNNSRVRRYYLRPYFFRWGQFGEQVAHGDTPHSAATQGHSVGRQSIRNRIEDEMVLPFISVLEQRTEGLALIASDLTGAATLFYPATSVDIIYPVPWFTGHEVGVQLTFQFDIPIC